MGKEELRKETEDAVVDTSAVEWTIEEEQPCLDPDYNPYTYQQAKIYKKPFKAILELPTKSLAE